jgi:hypothetical protein
VLYATDTKAIASTAITAGTPLQIKKPDPAKPAAK